MSSDARTISLGEAIGLSREAVFGDASFLLDEACTPRLDTRPTRRTDAGPAQMLFIDDRPYNERRPCSFNDSLLARADVLPILIRFPDTFPLFSEEYIRRTTHLPSFHVDDRQPVELEAARLGVWLEEQGLRPEFFCCMSEPQQEFGNALAERLGLVSMTAETTRALRFKPEMKRRLREAGLATAEFEEVASVADVRAFAARVGYPIVIKPTSGWGTLRTYLIKDDAAVEDHRRQIEGPESTMVESFVAEEEIECCALIHEGKVLETFVSFMPEPPLSIAQGALSANISIGSHKKKIPVDFDAVSQRIVDAFGLVSGYVHMEWFVDFATGEVTVGELALRYPGCEIAKNHGLAHGFDIGSATVDLYLGRRPKLEYSLERCVGDLLLPYREGRVLNCTTREELEALPGVLTAHLAVKPGDVLPSVPSSSFNCVGWVHVEGDSPTQVEERMRHIQSAFRLNTRLPASA